MRAYLHAMDAGADAWEFAVEIDDLRRARIANSDLRWLLSRGLAIHAKETPFDNGRRRFDSDPQPHIDDRSCFVITQAGLSLLGAMDVTSAAHASDARRRSSGAAMCADASIANGTLALTELPNWDRQRRELWVSGVLVKQLRRPAANQQAVLDLFEATNWQRQITDPLPLVHAQCPKRRLHDAIKALNRRHLRQVIRFSGDGSGQGVLWARVDQTVEYLTPGLR
jgi:hypothetical protein